MDVQVFGTRKCRDTQKALRFLKERRATFHFVDLQKRAASAGELNRFAQKFGAEALLDRESSKFRDLGLHAAHLPESRILPLLEENPQLLKTPLVRRGKHLALGHDPEAWAGMIEAS